MSYDLHRPRHSVPGRAERMLALGRQHIKKISALLSAAGALLKAPQTIFLTANEKDLSAGAGKRPVRRPVGSTGSLSRARIARYGGRHALLWPRCPTPWAGCWTEFDRPNGLHLTKRTVPIGVIGCDL